MARGKQRRAFVHLQKKLMQKGGAIEKLSEGERVSYNQLKEGLSAADIILFERLAAAQLQGEIGNNNHPPRPGLGS